jgi:hypothetical protein
MTMYLDDMHGDLVHGMRSQAPVASDAPASPRGSLPQAPRNPRA